MLADQPGGVPPSRERVWATFCHLAALTPLLGIPFGLVAGPLVVWLIKKDESAFVDRHGKAALNFQISMLLLVLLLAVVGVLYLWGLALLGPGGPRLSIEQLLSRPFLLRAAFPAAIAVVVLLLAIFDVVCVVMGAVRANKGLEHRYPLAIPFIR